MIQELTKENLKELENNSFLSKEVVEKDLESNPFGKYLILNERDILCVIQPD